MPGVGIHAARHVDRAEPERRARRRLRLRRERRHHGIEQRQRHRGAERAAQERAAGQMLLRDDHVLLHVSLRCDCVLTGSGRLQLGPHLERRALDDTRERSTPAGSCSAPPSSRCSGRPACRTARRRGPARRSSSARSARWQRRRAGSGWRCAARPGRRPSSRRPARRRRRSARRRRPSSRHCPTELKFSSAKPGGSMMRWHDAQAGCCRCSSSCSRTVFGAVVAPFVALLERRHVRQRRRRRRVQERRQDELAAEDRRGARRHRRQRQDAAVAEQAAAVRIGQLHLAEARRRRRPGCRSACASRSFTNV